MRNRPHSERAIRNVCFSIARELVEKIDIVAKKEGVSRSIIIRDAINAYIGEVEKPTSKGWDLDGNRKSPVRP